MIKWGTMELNDQDGHDMDTSIKMSEIAVITDPSATSAQTVLMGGGRMRRRVAIAGLITASDYSSLEADFFAMTKRSLQTNDVTMDAYIADLSNSRKIGSGQERWGYASYSVTWVEA